MQLSCLLTYCCLVLPVIWIALVLHLGHSTGGARVLIWTCWGLRSGLLRHGLNFSTAWCTTRLISIEKTGRMHPCRRWSLRTLTATLLAWHSSCHTPQPVLFRATNVWRNTANLQSDDWLIDKSLAFHKLMWRHFQAGWTSGLQFVLFWRHNVNNQNYVYE